MNRNTDLILSLIDIIVNDIKNLSGQECRHITNVLSNVINSKHPWFNDDSLSAYQSFHSMFDEAATDKGC